MNSSCIKQVLYSINLLIVTFLGVIIHQQPALSGSNYLNKNASDLVCYMQASDGKIISLDKLCGSSENNVLSTIDRQFLENYQRSLKKRLSVSLSQVALSRIQQQPQALITKAQSICQAIRSGMPTESLNPQGKAEVDIINALAPKYYCPEFHD